MNTARDRASISWPLIYLGGLALIFLLGLGCGLAVSGWWWRTPSPPPLVFVTAPPGPTQVGVVGTTPPGGRPGNGSCLTPTGWVTYTVESGDTLSGLAIARGITVDQVKQGNCLTSEAIAEGQQLYLPACVVSPPIGWESYSVQDGDTLFGLAAGRGATVVQLRQVNCLASDIIRFRDTLYLPALPTSTPTPLPPPTPVPTIAPPTPIPALSTPMSAPTMSVPTPAPTVSIPTPAPTVSIPTPAPTLPAPTLPAPTVPVPPTSEPPEAECSPLSCEGTLDSVVFKPLAPDAPDEAAQKIHFKPCYDIPEDVRLHTYRRRVELGERRFIFACGDFTKPISVTITRPDGLIHQPEVLEIVPNLALTTSNRVAAVIDWPVLPFYPTGTYTLTLTDSSGNSPTHTHTLRVIAPTITHTLIVPSAGPPGTAFLVYGVNFTSSLTLTFDVYGGDQPWSNTEFNTLTHRYSLPVRINQPLPGESGRGWGVAPLFTTKTDKSGLYAIGYDGYIRRPDWLFWLQ